LVSGGIRWTVVSTRMAMILDDKRMRALVILLPILGVVGCTPKTQEPSSAIVEKAKAAGAGDLANASLPSIEDWLRKHRDLAMDLDNMCKPTRQRGDAGWLDTTEGRVCTAAQNAAMYTTKKPLKKGDGQKFEPGWK
jgi:hypothetical protein